MIKILINKDLYKLAIFALKKSKLEYKLIGKTKDKKEKLLSTFNDKYNKDMAYIDKHWSISKKSC